MILTVLPLGVYFPFTLETNYAQDVEKKECACDIWINFSEISDEDVPVSKNPGNVKKPQTGETFYEMVICIQLHMSMHSKDYISFKRRKNFCL